MRFTVNTHGAHGAYVHRSKSATSIAAKVIGELETLQDMEPPADDNLTSSLDDIAEIVDRAWGEGAAHNIRRVTVNPGLVSGGAKVNMVAAQCSFEVDIRLPYGLDVDDIRWRIDAILEGYPEVVCEEILHNPANWSSPDSEMVDYVKANAKAVSGIEPVAAISLGCTDARLWRYHDVPAIVFGPSPIEMGGVDEYVEVDEFIDMVKVHVCSAYDYLNCADYGAR